MKNIILLTVLLSVFITVDLHSQNPLKPIKLGNEQSDELKHVFKDKLNQNKTYNIVHAGFISYSDKKRYVKGKKTDIAVMITKTVSMGLDYFTTYLKTESALIAESGQLFVLNGVHRDILVIVNRESSGREKISIKLYNQKLEELCAYVEKGEKLSEHGETIAKMIHEDPVKIIRWINAEKCKIQTEEMFLQTKEEFNKEVQFSDFQDLFEDITKYLGDMESFVFPFDLDEYNKKIALGKPIPEKFKHYLKVRNSNLDFCRNHLTEDRDFLPLYKIKNGENICLIAYYKVPEIPRRRVFGEYYFLYSFSASGECIDVYPLSFFGTEEACNDFNRYSEMWSLQDIKTVTTSTVSKNKDLQEFIKYSKIGKNGKAISEIEKLHFETLPKKWIQVTEENDQQYVIKDCGSFSPTIEFIIDEDLNMKVSYFTGQEASIYEVEEFRSDPHERNFRMVLVDEFDRDKRLSVKFGYDDSENMTIQMTGFSHTNSKQSDIFVQESIIYPGGHIKIKEIPCEEH